MIFLVTSLARAFSSFYPIESSASVSKAIASEHGFARLCTPPERQKMSKFPDQKAAALSDAKTSKPHTNRQAPKKPPKAVSGDFSAIAEGYIQAATAESTRRNFDSDMRHLAINGIYAKSPPE